MQPPPDRTGSIVGLTAVMAVLALAIAIVALALAGAAGGGAGSTESTTEVTLTEWAIEPSALAAAAGGRLLVENHGTVSHNLTIRDTELATPDIEPGGDATLDLSSLPPGSYEVLCSIPGHADQGMTGSLVIGAAGPADASTPPDDQAGGPGANLTEADYEAMDQAMEDSIAAYPAATDGVGNQALEPIVGADGTKQYELTAAITPWEVEPGRVVDAWTYNGMVPGPMIRVDVGDHVRIVLHNELPMGTDLHVHGINVPNAMDGVAPITQPLIEPGESFTYEFVTDEPAVAMYHAHHHGQLQVPNGLFGTIYVGRLALPAGQAIGGQSIPATLQVSQELPLVLNDSGVIGYSLNGKGFPATAPIVGRTGDWILVHYFNEGGQIHPMHLHQFDQIVVAKDGFPLDHPYVADTVTVAPGERYSVLVQLESPGTWVWHCHILNHVERDTGMYGMVTAVVVG